MTNDLITALAWLAVAIAGAAGPLALLQRILRKRRERSGHDTPDDPTDSDAKRRLDDAEKIRVRIAGVVYWHNLSNGICEACGEHATHQSLHQADVLMAQPGLSIRLEPTI